MQNCKYICYILISIFLLTGCANSEDKVKEFFQTDSATQVREDYSDILEHLIRLKTKLDKRNPQEYNKKISNQIYHELQVAQNNITLTINKNRLENYDDYFKYAFDKKPNVQYRNDFLILGIYKLIYEAYDMKNGHQITALTYNNEKLQKLYYYLRALKWRIKTIKDTNGEYLFLTWQKNWQIEFEKRVKRGEEPSWEMIQNLKYIKSNQENILQPSNFSFEVILSRMITDVKNTLKNIGEEPVDVGIEAIKGLVFFI